MKKNCAFILILILVLCLTFCACKDGKLSTWGDKISPWGDKNIENNSGGNDDSATKNIRIYVYGAVKNEGYYEVAQGETYLAAITKAGLLDCSWLSTNADTVVDEKQRTIVVQYLEDGTPHDCINANSDFFSLRELAHFDGLSDDVVNKIADYHDAYGKIPNKTVLLEVLGDDYANYHYKLYIAEADYEKAD